MKFGQTILSIAIVASLAISHSPLARAQDMPPAEESFADSYPILTFSLAAVGTIAAVSQIREGFQFSGDNRPVGGYILGGLYLIPPFLPSGGDDNRTQPHKTATAMAFFGLSIYNFIYLTKDGTTTDEILTHNLIGFGALVVYLWGMSKIFKPIQSYDIGTFVFPSVRIEEGRQTGLMNLYIPFN